MSPICEHTQQVHKQSLAPMLVIPYQLKKIYNKTILWLALDN